MNNKKESLLKHNGVSYVWLLEENQGNGDTIIVVPPSHEHDMRYLETIAPSCENLGYERWQCDGCGELQKMNYTPAVGHEYEDITIREATCKQGGLKLTLCKDCGDFHQETTPTGNHNYHTTTHNATCRSVGYTDHICEVCGDNFIELRICFVCEKREMTHARIVYEHVDSAHDPDRFFYSVRRLLFVRKIGTDGRGACFFCQLFGFSVTAFIDKTDRRAFLGKFLYAGGTDASRAACYQYFSHITKFL